MKKILHIIPTFGFGGISSVVSSWHDACHGKGYHFDYVAFSDGVLKDKFSECGSSVFIIPTLRARPFRYVADLIRVLSAEKYDVVHVHNSFKNGLALFLARLMGVKTRVCHSHTSGLEDGSLSKILPILKWIVIGNANVRVACGQQAGRFLYGKKSFTVINNTLDVQKVIDGSSRAEGVREDFGLPTGRVLLGHVGRFSEVKNHRFLLDIAERLDARYLFVLVGAGPLKNSLKEEVKARSLSDRFIFLDPTNEIPRLLAVFEAFVLPSLFEGVSLALLEAQAASLRCFVSEHVPSENDVGLGLVTFLPLSEPDAWASCVSYSQGEKLSANQIVSAFDKAGFASSSLLKSVKSVYG